MRIPEKLPNPTDFHFQRIIFYASAFETLAYCCELIRFPYFMRKKSRTEVRDFCLHLFVNASWCARRELNPHARNEH